MKMGFILKEKIEVFTKKLKLNMIKTVLIKMVLIKDNINKDTGTLYNIDGWDISGFNEKGINKITGFNFNERGYTQEIFFYNKGIFTKKCLKNQMYFFKFYV